MNTLRSYLIYLALLGSYAHGNVAQNSETNHGVIWKTFGSFVKKRCLKNASQNKYEEILKELANLKHVRWHSLIIETPTFEAHPQIHCHDLKPQIQGYLHKLLDKLESCLEKEENYLQQFIIRGYESYSHFFCNNIQRLVSDLHGNTTKCIRKLAGNSTINPHRVCYQKSRIFGRNSLSNVLTKQDLCEDLTNIRDCYAQILNDNCDDAAVLKNFQLGIISESLNDCQDVWYAMLKKYLKMQL